MADKPEPGTPSPRDSTSFVVETILDGLGRSLPEDQRGALGPYLESAPHLDGSEEPERRRGERCAKWAKALAEAQHEAALARVAAGIVEDARELEEKVAAALVDVEADMIRLGGTPHGFHTELNESFEALREANKVAAVRGWDAVPWRALLDDLFAVS
ncbi:MAG: hypothetical protein ACHQNA_04980 [Acidimicrobiales bacterium]